MPQCGTRTIEWFGLIERYLDDRIDELKEGAIGDFLVKIISLITNSVALAALHPMAVVIEHFLEWPAINHCLITLKTFALFSFECLDSDGTEFDSLHGTQRLGIALENLNPVETR